MKIVLTSTLPLVAGIVLGTAISWVSIYAFWFAVWIFHSVAIARVCDAIGNFLLIPGKWVFAHLGGDQSSIFFDPVSFSGTNGLILGLIFYGIVRMIFRRKEKNTSDQITRPLRERRIEATVHPR